MYVCGWADAAVVAVERGRAAGAERAEADRLAPPPYPECDGEGSDDGDPFLPAAALPREEGGRE